MDYLLNKYNVLGWSLIEKVLNLIINGLPSKQEEKMLEKEIREKVLNLIINGLPSKQ